MHHYLKGEGREREGGSLKEGERRRRGWGSVLERKIDRKMKTGVMPYITIQPLTLHSTVAMNSFLAGDTQKNTDM